MWRNSLGGSERPTGKNSAFADPAENQRCDLNRNRAQQDHPVCNAANGWGFFPPEDDTPDPRLGDSEKYLCDERGNPVTNAYYNTRPAAPEWNPQARGDVVSKDFVGRMEMPELLAKRRDDDPRGPHEYVGALSLREPPAAEPSIGDMAVLRRFLTEFNSRMRPDSPMTEAEVKALRQFCPENPSFTVLKEAAEKLLTLRGGGYPSLMSASISESPRQSTFKQPTSATRYTEQASYMPGRDGPRAREVNASAEPSTVANLSTKDVTSLLHISRRTLGRLTKSGVLRPAPETVPGPSGGSPAARYTLDWLNLARAALGLPTSPRD